MANAIIINAFALGLLDGVISFVGMRLAIVKYQEGENMTKKIKNTKGFTLLEVMTGMVILAVGLLLLMPMMVVSMQANDFARNFTEASMLIKEKMEELKNMSIPVSGADSVGTVSRVWTVTDATANLKKLVVNINWTDRDGRPRSNSMMSYMMVD